MRWKSLLSQVLDKVFRMEFTSIVRKYGAEQLAKRFSTKGQFLHAMLF